MSGAGANGTNFFPALRALNMSHNAFTGTLPASFGQSGIFNLKPLQVQLLDGPVQYESLCLLWVMTVSCPAHSSVNTGSAKDGIKWLHSSMLGDGRLASCANSGYIAAVRGR